MRIDILTIMPAMTDHAMSHGVIGRARAAGIVDLQAVDLRAFTDDRHRTTDDTPCGGGNGMVMKPDPIARALDSLSSDGRPVRVILTDPQGRRFEHSDSIELARADHLVFVCGRYEGVDQRVSDHLVTDAYSIGDYVLTGGELPALVMADAIIRHIPGALGNEQSATHESFTGDLLDYPQYTRPRTFRGYDVPAVLMGGDHHLIEAWRRTSQLTSTRAHRPDLWARFVPTDDDLRLLRACAPAELASLAGHRA